MAGNLQLGLAGGCMPVAVMTLSTVGGWQARCSPPFPDIFAPASVPRDCAWLSGGVADRRAHPLPQAHIAFLAHAARQPDLTEEQVDYIAIQFHSHERAFANLLMASCCVFGQCPAVFWACRGLFC